MLLIFVGLWYDACANLIGFLLYSLLCCIFYTIYCIFYTMQCILYTIPYNVYNIWYISYIYILHIIYAYYIVCILCYAQALELTVKTVQEKLPITEKRKIWQTLCTRHNRLIHSLTAYDSFIIHCFNYK